MPQKKYCFGAEGEKVMRSRNLRASDYRLQADRLRQQASKIAEVRKRIELLDMASHYETLAATQSR